MSKKSLIRSGISAFILILCWGQVMAAGNGYFPAVHVPEKDTPSFYKPNPIYAPPGLARHAENLYQLYSDHSNGAVLFEVETVARGRLRNVADVPLGDLIEKPEYMVQATHFAREIRNPGFTPATFELPDARFVPSDFQEIGYPLDFGTYRVLQVGVAIGETIMTHQALELCWYAQGHCVLMEPAVIHLESIVGNILQAAADGWSPKVTLKKVFRTKNASGACMLSDEPGIGTKTVRYPARTVKYLDCMGNTVVTKQLGEQIVEVSCAGATEEACKADPGGETKNSSCNATDPFDCAEDEEHGEGKSTDEKSGKSVSETKSTHLPQDGTQAAGAVDDAGKITVHVDWTLNGLTDANGDDLQKSCTWDTIPTP